MTTSRFEIAARALRNAIDDATGASAKRHGGAASRRRDPRATRRQRTFRLRGLHASGFRSKTTRLVTGPQQTRRHVGAHPDPGDHPELHDAPLAGVTTVVSHPTVVVVAIARSRPRLRARSQRAPKRRAPSSCHGRRAGERHLRSRSSPRAGCARRREQQSRSQFPRCVHVTAGRSAPAYAAAGGCSRDFVTIAAARHSCERDLWADRRTRRAALVAAAGERSTGAVFTATGRSEMLGALVGLIASPLLGSRWAWILRGLCVRGLGRCTRRLLRPVRGASGGGRRRRDQRRCERRQKSMGLAAAVLLATGHSTTSASDMGSRGAALLTLARTQSAASG